MLKIFPNNVFHQIYFRGNFDQRQLYLTFDDGPTLVCTPHILKLCKKLKIKATFFVTGENAHKYPSLLQDISRAGHCLGCHGYEHISLLFRSQSEIRQSIFSTNQVIEKATGTLPKFFRPPFGRFGWSVVKICREQRMKIVLWNIMPHDYKNNITANNIISRITHKIQPGSIIVLHDNLQQPQKLLQSLPVIVERARRNGFQFKILAI